MLQSLKIDDDNSPKDRYMYGNIFAAQRLFGYHLAIFYAYLVADLPCLGVLQISLG